MVVLSEQFCQHKDVIDEGMGIFAQRGKRENPWKTPEWLRTTGSFHIKRQLRGTEGRGRETGHGGDSFFSEGESCPQGGGSVGRLVGRGAALSDGGRGCVPAISLPVSHPQSASWLFPGHGVVTYFACRSPCGKEWPNARLRGSCFQGEAGPKAASSKTVLLAPVFSESPPCAGSSPVSPLLLRTAERQMRALISLWQMQKLRPGGAGCRLPRTGDAPNRVRNAFLEVARLAGGGARIQARRDGKDLPFLPLTFCVGMRMALILLIQLRIIADLSGASSHMLCVTLTQPCELGLIVHLQVAKEEGVAWRGHIGRG